LVLIVGSVSPSVTFSSSSSFILLTKAFADDMPDGGGEGAPQEAPAQSGGDGDSKSANTETLTLGPTRGDIKEDDRKDGDKYGDSGRDSNQEKQASKEGPKATEVADCRPGEQPDVFTNKCEPTVLADNPTNSGPTTAATSCPVGPTPTSYYLPDDLSVTNTVWGYNNDDYKVNAEKVDRQRFHLHWMASPGVDDELLSVPGVNVDKLLSDPSFRSLCTGEPVTVVSPDKDSATTYDPDGTKSVVDFDSLGDPVKMTEFDSKGKRIKESKFDPATGKLTFSDEYDPSWQTRPTTSIGYNPQTGKPDWIWQLDHDTNIQIETLYDPKTNKPTKITKSDPLGRRETVTDIDPNSGKPKATEEYYIGPYMKAPKKLRDITYVPGTDKQASVTDYDRAGNPRMKIDYNPDTGLPSTTTTFNPTTGKPDMQIKFKEDGVTPDGPALHYDEEGNPKSK
jgi:hypothetical protein